MIKQRKNSVKAIMSMLLLVSLAACHQDNSIDELSSKEPIPIQLSSGESIIQSRMSGTAFEGADEIGVFVLKQPATLADSRHVDNMKFTLDNTGKWIPQSPVFYPSSNSLNDFIAYYPYSISGVEAGKSTLPCAISIDQSNPANYAKSDFLVANHPSVSPQKEAVMLEFKHRLTEIHLVLLPGNAYESAEALLADKPIISIKGVNTTATYDFKDGSYSNQTSPKDVVLGGTFVVKDGKVQGKHAIMIPQEIAGDHAWIELSLGGKNYLYTFGQNHPLQPATKETYTLTIKKSLIPGTIETSISNWEHETDVSGDLTENEETTPLPPVSEDDCTITIPDFTTSSVYKVMKDNKQIAEICREYLYSEGVIDNQAIVVYPFIEEKTDLTKGYVVQVLNANAGTPVSSSTHGGSVSWNQTTNALTYVPGTKASVSTISMSKLYEFTATTSNVGTATTLVPEVLTHPVSNHVYPIVKVASQYWMGTNYNETTLINSTPIELIADKTKWANNQGASPIPPAYCLYEGSEDILYNHAAIEQPGFAPQGWEVPSETEWTKLNAYIKGKTAVIKDVSWGDDASNLTGLSMLKKGNRESEGKYSATNLGYFWCSEKYYADITVVGEIKITSNGKEGNTLRCIRQ